MTSLRKILQFQRGKKSRTVKSTFAFPIFLTIFAVLSASVIDSQNQSYIRVESSEETVKVGELFEISVYVSAHTPINAIDIALNFPKEQVEITGVDTGESVITLWKEDPYVEDNAVMLQGGTFRRGFLGEHLIARINARAKTSGLARFEVGEAALYLGDGSGSEVPADQTEKGGVKLYVANEDGTFTGDLGAEGVIELRIITDIDGDGSVSIVDLSQFMSAWTKAEYVFDFNGDGKMTFKDFSIILSDTFFK